MRRISKCKNICLENNEKLILIGDEFDCISFSINFIRWWGVQLWFILKLAYFEVYSKNIFTYSIITSIL